MRTVQLDLVDAVTVNNTGLSGGAGVVVGSPPVWKDGSDATYAEFAGQFNGAGEPTFGGAAVSSFQAIAEPLTKSAIYILVRLRLAAVLGTDVNNPRVDVGTLSLTPGTKAPLSPTWVEYRLTRANETVAGSWDNFFDTYPSSNLSVLVDTRAGEGILATHRWQIYEAEVFAVMPGEAPPCRIFPRSDGLGVGAGRAYPPPKSQQRSPGNRGVGYY